MNKLLLLIGVALLYCYALPGILRLNNTTMEQSLAQVASVAGMR